MRTYITFTLAAVLAVLGAAPAQGETTNITVRVISKDAKFIGSSMGGMRVILRDAETGELLAQGLTQGGTGNTGQIMHKDKGRRANLSDPSAAAFQTQLDLQRPRLIEAEAYGPLAQPQAAHRVSATQWVVPGKHLSGGDGWVLELPGFVVDVLEPVAHRSLPADTRSVELTANVTMMCGCPIEPGGLWDANRYEVAARVLYQGKPLDEVKMSYAGTTSRFEGQIPVSGSGLYDVTVYAYDPNNGNTGVDRTTFMVK